MQLPIPKYLISKLHNFQVLIRLTAGILAILRCYLITFLTRTTSRLWKGRVYKKSKKKNADISFISSYFLFILIKDFEMFMIS